MAAYCTFVFTNEVEEGSGNDRPACCSTVYVFMICLQLFSSINPFDDNLYPRRSDQLEEVVHLDLRTHNR